MVEPVVPDVLGPGGVFPAPFVVFLEHTDRVDAVRCPDDNLAHLAGGQRLPVLPDDVDVVEGPRLAQRPDLLDRRADKVAHQDGGLGLAVGLVDPEAGLLLKLLEDLGV